MGNGMAWIGSPIAKSARFHVHFHFQSIFAMLLFERIFQLVYLFAVFGQKLDDALKQHKKRTTERERERVCLFRKENRKIRIHAYYQCC